MTPELAAKLRQVRLRLNAARFLRFSVWMTAGCLLGAAAVVLVDKRLHWGVDAATAGGVAALAGLALAAMTTWVTRKKDADAAAEIDHAFNLKERVTTLLTLPAELRGTSAAIALQEDVQKRTAALAVGEKMPLTAPRFSWAPAATLAVLVGAAFVTPYEAGTATANARNEAERKEIAKEQTAVLAKKLADREKKEKAADPELAKELKGIAAKVEDISKDLTKKGAKAEDAVLKLADLAKSVEQKRQKYDQFDKMKAMLAKMPNMKDGPAEKLSQALKAGDFKAAAEQLQNLQKQIQSGKMSEEQRKKLAEQLDKIQKNLKDMANLSKKEQELRKNITNKEQLAKELAKLADEKKKLELMQKLAEKLAQCAQCNGPKDKQGEGRQASKAGKGQMDKMDPNAMNQQMAKELEEARELLEQLAAGEGTRQMLNEMLDELGEARNGMMDMQPNELKMSRSMFTNRGQVGMGARDEAPDDTKSRLSKANTFQNKGRVFATGLADGKSLKGDFKLSMAEIAAGSAKAADEAVTRQRVPREYEQFAKEYFQGLEKAGK
jgi:hypothetical protein